MYNWNELKVNILTKSNQLYSYTASVDSDLQPLITFFKKQHQNETIDSIFIQNKGQQGMTDVTNEYDVSLISRR